MTTGKDFGLPERYHDWVINDGKRKLSDFDDYIMVAAYRHQGEAVTHIPLAQLFPPKPKPTLPDVKPGAVVRWKQENGLAHHSIKLEGSGWHDYCSPVMQFGREYGKATQHQTLSDQTLLDHVDDDGFTVELDGL